ncbi:MAG: DUF1186 domain-containing protein [Caldilineaceae bacterium]|nr:DUF1186 domain-containing protein [Caldilineaceae bacterium]
MTTMTINEILDDLRRGGFVFPSAGMKAAVEQKEEITPHLLQILKDTNVDPYDTPEESMAYVAAMYLLAQFREKRAFPLIIEFCRLPEIEEFLNDIITEDLARILVSVFDGDVQSIQDLLEDEDTNEWVRAEMLRTLELLYALDKVDRDQLVAYHRRLYDKLRPEDDILWGILVHSTARLHFAELRSKINRAFTQNLVDLSFIGQDDVDQMLANASPETVESDVLSAAEEAYIDDAYAETRPWYDYMDEDER